MTVLSLRNYLFSHESIVISITILLAILNIVFFYNCPYKALIASVLIYIFYFVMSKNTREFKKVVLLATTIFIVGGVALESYIIKRINVVDYKFPLPNTNIPGWLFGAYFAFVLGAYHVLNIATAMLY